jgi:hypothetical protein
VDDSAKTHLQATYDIPNPTIVMADSSWTISIGGKTLVRKIREQIYARVHHPTIKAYWIKKEQFNPTTYNMVDWTATGKVMHTFPMHTKHNMVKHTSG